MVTDAGAGYLKAEDVFSRYQSETCASLGYFEVYEGAIRFLTNLIFGPLCYKLSGQCSRPRAGWMEHKLFTDTNSD